MSMSEEDADRDLLEITPGIHIRQRIKLTQNAKGAYQKEISIEVSGFIGSLLSPGRSLIESADDLTLELDAENGALAVRKINHALLLRAHDDADAAIERMMAVDAGEMER